VSLSSPSATSNAQSEFSSTCSGIYVAIHGHFYQPPRENPYLNAIERQDSASPFHDWNQRIHSECYRPNAFARIVSNEGKLIRIVNNYEYLSFNIGSTLLSWLEQYDPEVYQRIIDADRLSAARLNGHGNAIAQVYNHIIMPLANWRDKLTQIRWGKEDFKSRFGRDPEGMWLAETAVDYETLEALVMEGIKFIVLAPSQAQRCRSMIDPQNEGRDLHWLEVGGSQIDPTQPYRCYLRGMRHLDESSSHSILETPYIDIFFYDGPISRDMGFGDLLSNSYNFASRLNQAVRGDRRSAQLISVATDGETFGHHKHFTEKALAYAFTEEFPRRDWTVTNYAHYLSLNPPTWEVELKPVTAWSCAHGVGRWEDNCGCAGEGGVWHQNWRRPLRDTLNWLRDRLIDIYAEKAPSYFNDPWAARDAYIQVLRDSLRHSKIDSAIDSQSSLDEFFLRYGRNDASQFADRSSEQSSSPSLQCRVDALRLLEMQRHSLLMFTSCGWFFEEISRPEGVQILRYAARAIELAADISGVLLESEFINRLADCPSNVEQFGNGAEVYRQLVISSRISLEQVAAHYAIGSLFNSYLRSQQLYCYTIEQHDYQLQRMGAMTVAVGQIQLTSGITQESRAYTFAVLHLGGYDFHCCIKNSVDIEVYEEIKTRVFAALQSTSAAKVVLCMSEIFGETYYSLQHLFAEDRHRLLHLLSRETLTRLDQLYAQVYRDNYGILAAFRRDSLEVPPELQVAAEITLNQRMLAELKRLENGDRLPLLELDAVATEAEQLRCNLNRTEAAAILERLILGHIWQLVYSDEEVMERLHQIDLALDAAEKLHLTLNLDKSQELYISFLLGQIAPRCWLSDRSTSLISPELVAILPSDSMSSEELEILLALGDRMAIDVSDLQQRCLREHKSFTKLPSPHSDTRVR
jgi:alpha-amylase/alpha-mannosidase (GH57 family)